MADRRIFVGYPFQLGARDYRRPYREIADAYTVRFDFADERLSDDHVLVKIRRMIEQADFSIFDLTGWNPNVAVELGIAIGMNKRRFLLFNPTHFTNPREDVAADLRGFDRLEYVEYSQLQEKLEFLMAQVKVPPRRATPPASPNARDLLSELRGLVYGAPGITLTELASEMGIQGRLLRTLVASTNDISAVVAEGREELYPSEQAPRTRPMSKRYLERLRLRAEDMKLANPDLTAEQLAKILRVDLTIAIDLLLS